MATNKNPFKNESGKYSPTRTAKLPDNEEFAPHTATEDIDYGPYDPLDFEITDDYMPEQYGVKALAPYPDYYMAPTAKVDVKAEGKNEDKRDVGVAYGRNPTDEGSIT